MVAYWRHDRSVIIDPAAADASIHQIDGWKTQVDLTDVLLGKLAHDHFSYDYRILPNSPQVIREQLSAGRPLLAEVRTHGLGNPNYPGYGTNYEEQGWSVPHFVVIIGYDGTGVFLNDPGISKGRGYRITFAQLSHAIADLNQQYSALDQGAGPTAHRPLSPANTVAKRISSAWLTGGQCCAHVRAAARATTRIPAAIPILSRD